MATWSNLDFNHFSGFATYEIPQADGTVRTLGLLMGIGNEETENKKSQRGNDPTPLTALDRQAIAKLPPLTQGGPAFILTEGNALETTASRIPQALHDLYRAEGSKLAAAFEARTKAEMARRAYLLANPPAPSDVIVRFWEREKKSKAPNGEEGQ
jgi:hypothetical protein